jgi:hypothetical protein
MNLCHTTIAHLNIDRSILQYTNAYFNGILFTEYSDESFAVPTIQLYDMHVFLTHAATVSLASVIGQSIGPVPSARTSLSTATTTQRQVWG